MHNILVSVEADLPSSIALRYSCRLANLTEGKVQVIHVKEPDEAGPAVGAGWARLTWQKELLSQAKQEITQLLRDDLTHCATLADPIVAVGDREGHVLAELGRDPYDLLVLGLPAPPGASLLHHFLHSETMQKAHCPVLLALTMAPLQRALVCLDGQGLGHVDCFSQLMKGAELSVDLVGLQFQGGSQMADKERLGRDITEAKQILESAGFEVGPGEVRQGRPESMAAMADDYGLLVAPMVHEAHREHPWVALLGNTATSMLLC